MIVYAGSRETELKNRIDDTSKQINSDTSASKTVEPSAIAAVSIADELIERERRKYNLIVYNLPEPSEQDADKSEFINLCKVISNLDIIVIRLGKRFEDKCRPLLVGVEDLSHKTTVLSRAPSLRHHTQYVTGFWKTVPNHT